MAERHETPLSGVGVRHEIAIDSGQALSEPSDHGDRAEILIEDRGGTDSCSGKVLQRITGLAFGERAIIGATVAAGRRRQSIR